uniref:Uncharacterized protein n=1 Tax=Plectus sambesii TaxID=2011161 RepID=A0A914WSY8_9BILA
MVQRFCGSNSREKPTHKVLERIKKTIGRYPLAILKQIKQPVEENQVVLSRSTIFSGPEKLKITLKKCHYEFNRVYSAATKASWWAHTLDISTHAPENEAKCIFVNESWFDLYRRWTQVRSRRVRVRTSYCRRWEVAW